MSNGNHDYGYPENCPKLNDIDARPDDEQEDWYGVRSGRPEQRITAKKLAVPGCYFFAAASNSRGLVRPGTLTGCYIPMFISGNQRTPYQSAIYRLRVSIRRRVLAWVLNDDGRSF